MAIPTRWELTLPILEELAIEEMTPSALIDELAPRFKVTEDELNERTKEGNRRFANEEVGHAQRELKEAGLIDFGDGQVRPAHITRRGICVLALNPAKVDKGFLAPLKEERKTKEGYLSFLRHEEQEIRKKIIELYSQADNFFLVKDDGPDLRRAIEAFHKDLSCLIEDARHLSSGP